MLFHFNIHVPDHIFLCYLKGSAPAENRLVSASQKNSLFPLGWVGQQNSSKTPEEKGVRLCKNGIGKNGKFVPNCPIFL